MAQEEIALESGSLALIGQTIGVEVFALNTCIDYHKHMGGVEVGSFNVMLQSHCIFTLLHSLVKQ